jgi:TetR/AcrR family transcriptional regulator, transcriptional repressor for nem operon
VARPRAFDEAVVLSQARTLFANQGYNGTSIDDLVKATGLLRGSLYKAFGSKRNLFELLLAEVSTNFEKSAENLDLLTVALKDLASDDQQIKRICFTIVGKEVVTFSTLLGTNLLAKMKEK